MVSNRDDFIIAVRSDLLKKGNQQRFSLLGLIFFSLILLTFSSFNFKIIDYIKITINETVYRLSFVASIPINAVSKIYLTTNKHFTFYEDYEKNKIELKKLNEKDLLNKFIVLENKKLNSIINDFLIVSDEIVAKILIDKQSTFLKSMIANKGSKDGIKLGMAVLDGEYLVGKIVEMNYLTSRVLLLSDLNSKIPITIEPNGIQSILSGTGEDNGVIQYLKKDYDIPDNSVAYTSGAGDLFQAGIPIGKVENFKENNQKKVSFFSDFSQLEFIKIVSHKKIKSNIDGKAKELKRIKEEKKQALEQAQKILDQKKEEELKKIQVMKLLNQKKIDINALKVKNEKIQNEKKIIFTKLESKYGSKCKKKFFNNLYEPGTPEYKKCILNKGNQNKKIKRD